MNLKTPESVYPAPSLTEAEWAYLAGIIDGEASVGIQKSNKLRNPQYVGQITIYNTSMDLMDWIAIRLGNRRVSTSRLYEGQNVPCHQIRITGRRVVAILRAMLPYLIVKRQRALRVLELYGEGDWKFGGRGRGITLPMEEIQRRDLLYRAHQASITRRDKAA